MNSSIPVAFLLIRNGSKDATNFIYGTQQIKLGKLAAVTQCELSQNL